MNATSTETSEQDLVLKRGRSALRVLVLVNLAILVVAGGLSLTPFAEVGGQVLLWFVGIQLILAIFWFLPVLLFQLTIRRRGLAESWARALWSFVEALGYAPPTL